jgi:hypothetical protein
VCRYKMRKRTGRRPRLGRDTEGTLLEVGHGAVQTPRPLREKQNRRPLL